MTLTSEAFRDGETIPTRFTCQGDDISPPLRWSKAPENTVELTLIVEDPDAPGGTFFHWLVWGLAPGLGGIEQGAVPDGAREGRNDFGSVGWRGPCPPRGHGVHRYVFRIHALASPVNLEEGASPEAVKKAIANGVLASGELTGRYER